jgi:hypothetical protein
MLLRIECLTLNVALQDLTLVSLYAAILGVPTRRFALTH